MGFKAPKTRYLLDFDGTELEGLQVRMTGGKLGQAFSTVHEIGQLANVAPAEVSVADAQLALAQYEDLAGHLISWNLTDDDDRPVPADIEGLKTLETRYVNMIAAAWQRAQVDVPGPLPRSSPTGPPPDLTMIPMTSIPESLAS